MNSYGGGIVDICFFLQWHVVASCASRTGWVYVYSGRFRCSDSSSENQCMTIVGKTQVWHISKIVNIFCFFSIDVFVRPSPNISLMNVTFVCIELKYYVDFILENQHHPLNLWKSYKGPRARSIYPICLDIVHCRFNRNISCLKPDEMSYSSLLQLG